MRPIRPEIVPSRSSGFTLLEMILSIVIVAIIFGATLFFAYPIQQAGDVTTRAELTDMSDNALQRIGRDVRLALPNSVRVTANSGVYYLELIPLRTGARYRIESSGGGSGGGADGTSFYLGGRRFQNTRPIPGGNPLTVNEFLVLHN